MEDSKKKGISGIMNILKSSNNRLYKLLLILLSGICLMIVVWPANNSKTDKNDLKSGWTGQSDETDADVTGGNDRDMSGIPRIMWSIWRRDSHQCLSRWTEYRM